MSVLWPALVVAGAYVVGSMPWGYWIVRLRYGDDVRRHGSANTGATNVWRSFGWRPGLATALLDVLKGFLPALVALLLFGDGVAVLAAAAALMGHTFPIFLGLGGGKGVATGAGAAAALCPPCIAIAVAVWFGTLWLTRYVSLASIMAALSVAVTSIAFGRPWPTIAYGLAGGAMVIGRHHGNIRRLLSGTERRVVSFGRGRPRPDG